MNTITPNATSTPLSNVAAKTSHAFENGIAAAERTTDRVVDSADAALRATQRSAHSALGALSSSVEDLRQMVPAAMQRAADRARHAGDSTVGYIRTEPVKSVLLAAAAGALAVGLIAVFGRSRS